MLLMTERHMAETAACSIGAYFLKRAASQFRTHYRHGTVRQPAGREVMICLMAGYTAPAQNNYVRA